MASDIIDLIQSLTLIMEEETHRLSVHDRGRELAELSEAKIRLVGALEAELVRLDRETPGWAQNLEEERREAFTVALTSLGTASAANSDMLERHISLSRDMLDAIGREAQKLAGKRTETYSAKGDVNRVELATPISVNSQY